VSRSLHLVTLLASLSAALPVGAGAQDRAVGAAPAAGPSAPPGPGPADPPAQPGAGEEEEDDDPSLYEGWATPQEPAPAPARAEPITLLFNLGAYYTSAGLYLPLIRGPTPDAGERSEAQLYWTLLKGALVPRFLVLEASVNPMPCLGVAVHQWREAYDGAQVTGDLNLVQALTAGFDEPFALSLFVGNVADFDVRGQRDVRGRGYLGVVVSGGLGHIKDNVLVEDRWLEAEVKLKGDRVSEAQRLSWSFRAGVKLHDNPSVTDTAFLGLRRSRVDWQEGHWLLANSGFEYRFDLSLEGRPLRHLLVVDKKWPLGPRTALVLGVGVLWEDSGVYTGALADDRGEALQLLLRPNVVF
jgi:hypothetical protein